ncbi:hypothetical protein B0H14DRAFT_2644452 [Mycena olivaceomarginata]|nr:hypothetical protein B0H14DRAFT_2644452 [Mycena olivaceomarginata]
MDPSLSLEDVYASYAMEDMKLPALPVSSSTGPAFRDQAYFDNFRFSTNRQGDGYFTAAFKCNQALHDLRLSQIKASLARITDLNVLKEHLPICERGNWADEVTTMIVERQIEIVHPAPQRRQLPRLKHCYLKHGARASIPIVPNALPFSERRTRLLRGSKTILRLSPATTVLKKGVLVYSGCGAGLCGPLRGQALIQLYLPLVPPLGRVLTTLQVFKPLPLFSLARRSGRSLFSFSQLLPLIPSLMERIWEHYHKENCSRIKLLINSGTTAGELSALQSLFIGEDYSPTARRHSYYRHGLIKPRSTFHNALTRFRTEFGCFHSPDLVHMSLQPLYESGTECTPTRMGGSCVECILQLSPTCEHVSLSWFFSTHRKELSAFSALAANKPDFAKVVKWDKWNQLMPYAQEIVSKQVYEEFASFVKRTTVLSKLSVNILQDILDGAIIAAKARKSKAREASIISSRLPQGITIPTQDVVDRFRANLGGRPPRP